MKGCIAKRYGDLIHEIWRGTAKTIAPLKLRVIYLYAYIFVMNIEYHWFNCFCCSGQLGSMLHVLMAFNNMIPKNYLLFY